MTDQGANRPKRRGERIGVYVCECGPNIADRIDIERIIGEISPLNGIEEVEKNKLLCSEAGKEFLRKRIKEKGLTHLVLGACSHKQHEATFMKVCEEADFNPHLFQLVNIREQCAWVTLDKDKATLKALRFLCSALSRVRYQSRLEKKQIECTPHVLVIGGGIAGIQTSLLLSSGARNVYLVEKKAELGGNATKFERLYQSPAAVSLIREKLERLKERQNIEVFTGSEIEEVLGFFGNFEVKVRTPAGISELKVGAVVLTPGYRLYDPASQPRYGYRIFDDVCTSFEFEQMNMGGKILCKNNAPPRSAAIVQCVGREDLGYCSKICCSCAAKIVGYLTSKIPGIEIHRLHQALCGPGRDVRQDNVHSIRGTDIAVTEEKGIKTVAYKTENGETQSITADMIILMSGIEPPEDAPELAQMLNISLDEKGFFAEEHVKLNPVGTSLEGVFIAGSAQGPNDITECVVQSEAASARILSSLIPGKKLEPEVRIAHISEMLCTGCKTCLSVCAYSAIHYDDAAGVCVLNDVLCRGCGNCASACPSDAVTHKYFTSRQLYQELIEVVQ